MGLLTVFDAVLTGRQSSQKLQCLYENGKLHFPKLNFTQFVNHNVKIIKIGIAETRFAGKKIHERLLAKLPPPDLVNVIF